MFLILYGGGCRQHYQILVQEALVLREEELPPAIGEGCVGPCTRVILCYYIRLIRTEGVV
jgi:hypothetical protein